MATISNKHARIWRRRAVTRVSTGHGRTFAQQERHDGLLHAEGQHVRHTQGVAVIRVPARELHLRGHGHAVAAHHGRLDEDGPRRPAWDALRVQPLVNGGHPSEVVLVAEVHLLGEG